MKNKLTTVLIALTCFACFSLPANALDEVVQTERPVTIALGDAAGSVKINSVYGVVKSVSCFVPTLDADDTATMSLTQTDKAGNSWVPNNWVDKAVGATDDNAVVVAAPSSGSNFDIYAGGSVTVTLTASTTQTAARSGRVTVIFERKKR